MSGRTNPLFESEDASKKKETEEEEEIEKKKRNENDMGKNMENKWEKKLSGKEMKISAKKKKKKKEKITTFAKNDRNRKKGGLHQRGKGIEYWIDMIN